MVDYRPAPGAEDVEGGETSGAGDANDVHRRNRYGQTWGFRHGSSSDWAGVDEA